jgi:hypothetical protein
MLDIQAEIDMRITEEESRSMLLMADGLDVSPTRIVFACTYTLSATTMRRGEECYSQKLGHDTSKINRFINIRIRKAVG